METLPASVLTADARILLVEDDPDDVEIIQRVLNRIPISVDVDTCSNGNDALDFLERSLEDGINGLPDLILLDLNMPVMDGKTFIAEIRRHARMSSLPICVFTTSTDEDVIKSAYDAGANAVVSKVDSLDGMSEILNTIVDFWFRTAKRYYIE
ncbi:MAG: response regulator [Pseudomonadota bacterium]